MITLKERERRVRDEILRDFPWIYAINSAWESIVAQVRICTLHPNMEVDGVSLHSTRSVGDQWWIYLEYEHTDGLGNAFLKEEVVEMQWKKGQRLADAMTQAKPAHLAHYTILGFALKYVVPRHFDEYRIYRAPKGSDFDTLCKKD